MTLLGDLIVKNVAKNLKEERKNPIRKLNRGTEENSMREPNKTSLLVSSIKFD